MRRRLALAAIAFSLPLPVLFGLAHGCSPRAPTVQDFCGFLGDPGNCYLALVEDMGARCGRAGSDMAFAGAPKGFFLTRDKLDQCILAEGGTITFDTPPTLAAFPPTSLGFTVKDATGAVCGSYLFAGEHDYSITVNAATAEDGGVLADAGEACGADASQGAVVCGGNYASVSSDEEFVNTSCGKDETHTFISLQLDKCTEQKALLPRYEIEASAGGIETPGFIRLRVFYPKSDRVPEGVVEYFDCAIPGAPKGCCNGVKDGFETDIDCGGPTDIPSAACDRCAEKQGCISSGDCQGGGKCMPSPETGLKQCVGGSPAGASVCDSGNGGAGGGGPGPGSGGAGGGAGGAGGA